MAFETPPVDSHLDALAETTPDAFVTIDAKSVIQYANPALEDVLGYAPSDVVGERLTVLIPEGLTDQHLDAVDRYLSTGERHLDWEHTELPGEHSAGHEVPLSISFSEFRRDGEQYFTGVLRDISERRALEAERDLLYATKDAVIRADDVSEGLTDALRLVGSSMDWVYGEVWTPDDAGERIEWDTCWAADDADVSAFSAQSAETSFEPGRGLVGRVWQTGEHEWVSNVSAADNPVFERSSIAVEAGLGAAVGVPIQADGTVAAVLVFYLRDEREADDRMVSVTRAVASDLGLLVARKRAEETLRAERDLVSHILQTTPAGIVVLGVDEQFRVVNDRAEQLLGIEPDESGQYPPPGALPLTLLDLDGEPLSDAANPYRTVLRDGEEAKRDVGIEYPDGQRRWVAVHGAPLRDPDGDVTKAVFTFEDVTDWKRQAERLERLNELGQALSDADSFDAACDRAVTRAADLLGLPLASIERYDSESGRLRPSARTEALAGLVGDDPLFGSDRDPLWEAFVQNEPYIDDDVAAGATPLGSVIVLPLARHGVFVCGAAVTGAFAETDVHLAKTLRGHVESVFDRLDREAELRTQKSALEAKNEQLERVQRVNRATRATTRALMDATSEGEIKQLVCDHLADSDTYRFAWFGERDFATDEVVPTASAGVEEGYLDAIDVSADTSEAGMGPGGRALRTRTSQIQNDLQSDPPFEPWRQEAIRRGYRASISVPVVYRGTLYGLLNLYANEPGVFSEMEGDVLTELGEMIGYALNAMERYNALVSEASVELEFVVGNASNPLFALLEEHGGSVRLENIGDRDAGALRVFVAFSGLAFETVESFFEDHLYGEDLTLIRERDDETIVEVVLPEDSFLVSLVERGALPTDIRASPAEARITVQIPQSASVREYVELFEQRFGDRADLVARRESPEPVQSEAEFERAYVDRLTDRQHEVLQTAYFAGFFEQPRENSARDVAEMLDVSQPTVSRHLRNSQQTLFSMLFDEGTRD